MRCPENEKKFEQLFLQLQRGSNCKVLISTGAGKDFMGVLSFIQGGGGPNAYSLGYL